MSDTSGRSRPVLNAENVQDLNWDDFEPLLKSMRTSEGKQASIYHYTTVEGVKGIIESDALQASSVFFMNDSTEVRHSLEIIMDRLDELLPIDKSRTVAQHILASAFTKFVADADTFADAYVSCFCRKDDLLSQWRAYGKEETCYSIKFSVKVLASFTTPMSFLAPVAYLPRSKIERADKLIKGAMSTLDRFEINDFDEEIALHLLNHLGMPFLIAALFMKHEAFKEENEWRLVCFPFFTSAGEIPPVALKTRDGILTPYVNLKISEPQKKLSRLPIKQLRVGPSPNAQLAKRGLNQLLKQHGLSSIPVVVSETPLR